MLSEIEKQLFSAAVSGNDVLIESCIDAGADINAVDEHGITALMIAAISGRIDVIKILLDLEAKTEARDINFKRPVIHAAENGHVQAIEILLERSKNKDTGIAIIYAAKNGHAEAVLKLLALGATVDVNDFSDKITALMHAAKNGHSDIVEILLNAGADLTLTDRKGNTALIYAAQNGHSDAIAKLVERGANPNTANDFGFTVLMHAAQNGHSNAIEKLVKLRANPNAANKARLTALMFAAQNGHSDAIEKLVELGANPNAFDELKTTALIYAAKNGHSAAIAKLVDRGAKIEEADKYGMTALMYTVCRKYSAALDKLLELGANPNAANCIRETALMLAALNGHSYAIEKLVELGADINAFDKLKLTALMHAAQRRQSAAIAKLLELGADPSLLDDVGVSALSLDSTLESQNLIKTAIIAWKKISKQTLSEDESKFSSSSGYDKSLATKHVESRAARVVDKLKAGFDLTEPESAFLNNPVCKYLAAFQEFRENSQFIASTSTLFGKGIPGDALNMIFGYLPKKEGFEKQAVLISSIKKLLYVYQVNINGEKRFLRLKEMEAKDPNELLELCYYLMRSLQGKERDVSFETGEEITISSLLAKFKPTKAIHSSVMYQEKGVEALEHSPKIYPIDSFTAGEQETLEVTTQEPEGEVVLALKDQKGNLHKVTEDSPSHWKVVKAIRMPDGSLQELTSPALKTETTQLEKPRKRERDEEAEEITPDAKKIKLEEGVGTPNDPSPQSAETSRKRERDEEAEEITPDAKKIKLEKGVGAPNDPSPQSAETSRKRERDEEAEEESSGIESRKDNDKLPAAFEPVTQVFRMEVVEFYNPIVNHPKHSEILLSAHKYKSLDKLFELAKDKEVAKTILEEVDAQGADKVIEIIFGKNQPNADEIFRAIDHDKEVAKPILEEIQNQGADKLFKAIDRNDIAEVMKFISKNSTLVNAINADGNSALFMAYVYGNSNIANYLAENGAIAHEHVQEGNTIMEIGAFQINSDDFDAVKAINRFGVGSEDSFNGLHLAGLLTMLMSFHYS